MYAHISKTMENTHSQNGTLYVCIRSDDTSIFDLFKCIKMIDSKPLNTRFAIACSALRLFEYSIVDLEHTLYSIVWIWYTVLSIILENWIFQYLGNESIFTNIVCRLTNVWLNSKQYEDFYSYLRIIRLISNMPSKSRIFITLLLGFVLITFFHACIVAHTTIPIWWILRQSFFSSSHVESPLRFLRAIVFSWKSRINANKSFEFNVFVGLYSKIELFR